MPTLRLSTLLCALLLGACSSLDSVKLWPFDKGSPSAGGARGPAGATAYQCSGGKGFYLRKLDNGNAVWLILPEREVNLAKTGADRYSNGVAVLEFKGAEAALTDGTLHYTDCKVPPPAK